MLVLGGRGRELVRHGGREVEGGHPKAGKMSLVGGESSPLEAIMQRQL